MSHIAISADILRDCHIQTLADAISGWATWERQSEGCSIDEKSESLSRADIAVGWAPPQLLASSKVRWYLCGSSGIDGYLGYGLEKKPGFTFCNAAGVMSVPIAVHALAGMFALTRRLLEHERFRREGLFQRIPDAGELSGAEVCIVGLGGSGTELARKCKALGMHVVGVRRSVRKGHPEIEKVYPLEELAEAVRTASHVVCTLPSSPETNLIFNASVFAAMPPGAFFHNVSRGRTVNGTALEHALTSGHLGGAALDVYYPEPVPSDSALWTLPNVILTGHSAGWSVKLADRLCELFLENLTRLRAGRALINIIQL